MGKGLPRSLAQAALQNTVRPNSPVVTRRYPINHTFNVAAAGAGNGAGTVVIGDFPEGNILVLGRAAQLAFSTTSANITNATYTPTFAFGTTPDADVNLASPTSDSDLMSARANTIAAGKVSPATNHFQGSDVVALALNNRDGSLEVNLNVTVPAADIADASSAPFTATGFFEMTFAVLGDG